MIRLQRLDRISQLWRKLDITTTWFCGPNPGAVSRRLNRHCLVAVMYGRKRDEARKIAKKAIEGYVEILSKHKEPILTDEETLVTTLDFEYASTSGS